MQIALLSIYISLTSTILAACIAIPIGGFIHFYEFRGKKVLIALIQTLYSLPTVVVGLLIYLMISRSGPLGFFGLLYTPQGMILGQTILIIPMMTGLAIAALKRCGPRYPRHARLPWRNRVPEYHPDRKGGPGRDPQCGHPRLWPGDIGSRGRHDDRREHPE